MNRILVIGGTGNIGRQIVAQLSPERVRIRALARDPEAAHLPAHIEVMRGDLTVPDTLDACLAGVDTVFLVWTAPPAAFGPAFERVVKHARRIVYLSAPLKTPHPFFQQPNSARRIAEEIERSIEESGLQWTFLRPGMFALNARHFWGPQIRAGDLVRWPYLDAPTAPIDELDIAAVAVQTITEDGHAGMEYVMTGPESLSQFEQIATIGSMIGRALRIEEASRDETLRIWLKDFPEPAVSKLLDAWAAAIGQPAWITSTVQELTGRPARTFREWVTRNASEFRTKATTYKAGSPE